MTTHATTDTDVRSGMHTDLTPPVGKPRKGNRRSSDQPRRSKVLTVVMFVILLYFLIRP